MFSIKNQKRQMTLLSAVMIGVMLSACTANDANEKCTEGLTPEDVNYLEKCQAADFREQQRKEAEEKAKKRRDGDGI